VVEVGQSDIYAVVQVSGPSFAGKTVTIDSSQLATSCTDFSPTNVTLDEYGNSLVLLTANDCAPGRFLLDARLTKAPHTRATTTIRVERSRVTPEGLHAYPNPEVETDDGTFTGSNVIVVFYVEMPPVYAGAPVDISSSELQDRCQSGFEWESGNGGGKSTTGGVSTTLDSKGNAVFAFEGISCAAGSSKVIADVAGHTFKTTFTSESPEPTI
jgi:hypothetical protein